ncbi:hypothetical protein [Nesterenkonia natronophila]|uniref:Uncharacterized protein n=1 Tax=Nesterenkonia natronophila TaxID=2174932 RepID=A0A3A4FI44_9MICC|nr:hypothetical protein [Nesterenkonia natronophila]RJN31985.1 hypothetical protein D3250_07745 [Nesterenkonia natronophila]
MSTPSAHNPQEQNATVHGAVPSSWRREGASGPMSADDLITEPVISPTFLATFALVCVALLFLLLIGEIWIFALGR